MIVSELSGKILKSTIDPCVICGKRVMGNLCTVCNKWIYDGG